MMKQKRISDEKLVIVLPRLWPRDALRPYTPREKALFALFFLSLGITGAYAAHYLPYLALPVGLPEPWWPVLYSIFSVMGLFLLCAPLVLLPKPIYFLLVATIFAVGSLHIGAEHVSVLKDYDAYMVFPADYISQTAFRRSI